MPLVWQFRLFSDFVFFPLHQDRVVVLESGLRARSLNLDRV